MDFVHPNGADRFQDAMRQTKLHYIGHRVPHPVPTAVERFGGFLPRQFARASIKATVAGKATKQYGEFSLKLLGRRRIAKRVTGRHSFTRSKAGAAGPRRSSLPGTKF